MKISTFVFFALIIIGCKEKPLSEIKKENEYYLFKKQISPNEKFDIFKYCRNGTFAFSGDICGTFIREKGESFSENNNYKIEGNIKFWENDTLSINRFDSSLNQPRDTTGKISYEKFKDLTLKIYTYGSINSSGIKKYSFDNFKITKKQLCFENIKSIMGEPLKDNCFDLGNIEIINSTNGLKEIIIERISKSMDFKYRNSDGTITENLPEIKVLDLHLIPTKKIKIMNIEKLKGVFIDVE
ncbi:hypothetical protein [Halpernia frigidisoli]|nr:hypothetical protein [Halpernia frigidisoli]